MDTSWENVAWISLMQLTCWDITIYKWVANHWCLQSVSLRKNVSLYQKEVCSDNKTVTIEIFGLACTICTPIPHNLMMTSKELGAFYSHWKLLAQKPILLDLNDCTLQARPYFSIACLFLHTDHFSSRALNQWPNKSKENCITGLRGGWCGVPQRTLVPLVNQKKTLMQFWDWTGPAIIQMNYGPTQQAKF